MTTPPPPPPSRWSGLVATYRTRARQLSARYPIAEQIMRAVLAPETLDRCFAVAAQIFITAIPMLIAVTAFAPPVVRDHIIEGVTRQFGIRGQSSQDVTALFSGGGRVRESVGVAGLMIALLSATSLTRRLQHIYEDQWRLPPGATRSAAGRWVAWILLWIAAFAAQGPLRAGAGVWLVVGWAVSAAMTIGLWWWTPHLLLLRRVSWSALLPTALLTGGAMTVLGIGSEVLMPRMTSQSVAHYGPFGITLTLMSWLLVASGVIVIGAEIGRIVTPERHHPFGVRE